MVAAKNGAKCVRNPGILSSGMSHTQVFAGQVVLTDYPDEPLLNNLQQNVEKNIASPNQQYTHVMVSMYLKVFAVFPDVPIANV